MYNVYCSIIKYKKVSSCSLFRMIINYAKSENILVKVFYCQKNVLYLLYNLKQTNKMENLTKNTLPTPKDLQDLLNDVTSFEADYGDGNNIGGTINDNYDYTIHIDQFEENEDYSVYVSYHGEEDEDPIDADNHSVTLNSVEDLIEFIKELEEIISK